MRSNSGKQATSSALVRINNGMQSAIKCSMVVESKKSYAVSVNYYNISKDVSDLTFKQLIFLSLYED